MSDNIIKTASINSVTHQSDDGQIQNFYCADVVAHGTGSLTLHEQFSTEWVCVVEGAPYVCRTDEGACLVDYHAEYTETALPLEPFTKQEYCANEKDSEKALLIAKLAIQSLSKALNLDLSNIAFENVG